MAGETAAAVRYPEGPATESPAGGAAARHYAPRAHSLVEPGRSRGRGDAPFPDEPPGRSSPEPPLSPTPSPIGPTANSPASPATVPHRRRAPHLPAAPWLPDLPPPAPDEVGLYRVPPGRGDRAGTNGHGQRERAARIAARSAGRLRARAACRPGLHRVSRHAGEPRARGTRGDLHRVPRQPPHRRPRLRDVPPHRGHHPGARASGRRAPRL